MHYKLMRLKLAEVLYTVHITCAVLYKFDSNNESLYSITQKPTPPFPARSSYNSK